MVRARAKTPWDFYKSVFGTYIRDDEELLMKCFELDWKSSKIPKLIKDPAERASLKEILRKNYRVIRECFKFFAAFSPINNVPCLGQLSLQEIMNGIGCIDNQYLKLTDIDIEFTSTNAGIKGNLLNPERGLVRY